MEFCAYIIAQLRLVNLQITAQEDNNIFIRFIFLIDDGFAGFFERNFQKFADFLNRRGTRRFRQLKLLLESF